MSMGVHTIKERQTCLSMVFVLPSVVCVRTGEGQADGIS